MQAELFGWRVRLPRRRDSGARERNEGQALGTNPVPDWHAEATTLESVMRMLRMQL
jgi:hypothetical protein